MSQSSDVAGGAHLVPLRFARLGEPKESRGRFRQGGTSICIVGLDVMDERACALEAAVLLGLCVRPVTSADQTIDAERCPEQWGGRARNGTTRVELRGIQGERCIVMRGIAPLTREGKISREDVRVHVDCRDARSS